MNARAVGFSLIIYLLAGCAPPSPDDPASSAGAIIGGTSDTGDPSVVALYAQTKSSGALCTASVIAPTVLLTAAHCVLPSEVGAGATFVALPSENLNTSTTEQWAVKETHYDPAFDINELQNGHDVAVAILEQATTATPLALNTADPSALVGKNVKLVGYGVSNATAQTGAGIKRTVNAPVDAVTARLIQIGGDGKDTCQGDSGGPAMANVGGQDVIVGITSFGQSGCGAGGYDTRIDLYASFLAPYLKTTQPDATTEAEPNDTESEANDLAEGTMSGTLAPKGDVDWFKFRLPRASTYSLNLATSRASATFRVYKQAASGSLSSVGTASGADGTRTFQKTSSDGGTYYVKVYDDGQAHTDTGSYKLELN